MYSIDDEFLFNLNDEYLYCHVYNEIHNFRVHNKIDHFYAYKITFNVQLLKKADHFCIFAETIWN